MSCLLKHFLRHIAAYHLKFKTVSSLRNSYRHVQNFEVMHKCVHLLGVGGEEKREIDNTGGEKQVVVLEFALCNTASCVC